MVYAEAAQKLVSLIKDVIKGSGLGREITEVFIGLEIILLNDQTRFNGTYLDRLLILQEKPEFPFQFHPALPSLRRTSGSFHPAP
jgi:hypothetical protein